MMFAMFFLAEFSNMMLVSAIATTVFFGGWAVPFMPLPEQPDLLYTLIGGAIFFAKMYVLILLMMWIRWTFPRVRPDHLMNMGWKFMLPLAFVNLLVCAGVAVMQAEAAAQGQPVSRIAVWIIGAVSLAVILGALSLFKEKERPYHLVSAGSKEEKE